MDTPSIGTKLLAGGVAGASETLITYPAEFIKTRRQLPSSLNANTISTAPTTRTIIRTTYLTFGLRGFYSGCPALVASNALKSSIRFLAFETSKTHLTCLLPSASGGVNPVVNILAGLTAGVAEAILVVTPGEAVKTRVVEAAMRGGGETMSVPRMVTEMVRKGGIGALWKGVGPVLCKQGINSAVRFTTFATLQEAVVRRWPDGGKGVLSTLAIGAVSGVVTVYASMPLDNIKTRMQSSRLSERGMLGCATEILRGGGLAGFWKGTSPRLVRLTLSSGITFAVYDQVVTTMRRFKTEQSDFIFTV